MPVEETANLLHLIAYVAQAQKDVSSLNNYWNLLDIWGEYLITVLPDPGN